MFRDQSGSIFRAVSVEELGGVAEEFLRRASGRKVWLFSGEMGAGKTTFIKKLCEALGVRDSMSSPTFSIINEYEAGDGARIFHFDFFRIRNQAEALDIGTDEYLDSGNYCFIEWPEKIDGLIPPDHAHVSIQMENESLRTIAISLDDGKEKNRI
jgi:tRNA threonylcarbamoyladenosine biosynthesis protein TsaE